MIGRNLGHYRVEEELGRGGMGVVYRATDSKLGRQVAIKVLPESFAKDPERLARFEREARMLAALNHPHIAAIYGLEESGGHHYLVLELVPGKPLQGPLSVEEALRVAGQIAEALEAAHEKGIVHRDLKPANVMITPERQVKVLDFGLAKSYRASAEGEGLTLSVEHTREGTILGTGSYMSPEQARGAAVDRRTDIWAFGCVLYEMLTGRRAFPGETLTDTLGSILHREPDWEALPPQTPGSIRTLLRRCLQKDPHKRLADAGSARLELEEAPSAETAPGPAVRGPGWWALGGVLAGALAAGLMVWSLMPRSPSAVAARKRLAVTVPAVNSIAPSFVSPVAISPDGTRLVFVGRSGPTTQLFLRVMDQPEIKPLAGTEGATGPFFSPDGQWVGFFGEQFLQKLWGQKLKKVSLTTGAVVTLCEASWGMGGSWAPDDRIYFTPTWLEGVRRVSAAGGKSEAVTQPDPKKGESSHRWPVVLPGGEALLFSSYRGISNEHTSVEVVQLKTGQRRTLLEGASNVRYVSGHLLFVRGGLLMAVPFDVGKLEVMGTPFPVLQGVSVGSSGAAIFAASEEGSLVYVAGSGSEPERSLVFVDRKGNARPVTQIKRAYEDMALSPDGRWLAVTVEGTTWNVWVYEFERDSLTRLTLDRDNRDPTWSPDGKRVVYNSFRDGQYGLFWKPADNSGPEERLTSSGYWQVSSTFSQGDRLVLYSQWSPKSLFDTWELNLDGNRKTRIVQESHAVELMAAVSPDGKWLAYGSDESGRDQLYVQPYPGPGSRVQISTDGGSKPRWSRDGRELFYRHGNKMMAVSVETRPAFKVAAPRVLFEGNYWIAGWDYDIMPDGQRFVMIKEEEQAGALAQIEVILNWTPRQN